MCVFIYSVYTLKNFCFDRYLADFIIHFVHKLLPDEDKFLKIDHIWSIDNTEPKSCSACLWFSFWTGSLHFSLYFMTSIQNFFDEMKILTLHRFVSKGMI